ncbi:MAG: diacylglycerol/lipid kinase family protein [Eggerthellaceae bacterium]
MRTLVVNNTKAGAADGAIFDFIRLISDEDTEVVVRNLGPSLTTSQALTDAADFDLVVASGGDGTLASVSYELRNTGIPILPFPAGTSNALATNLLSPTETHALADLAKNMLTLDFDLAEFECQGTTYGFELVAGCGYDATIMSKAAELKQAMGSLAYFHAALTNPLPVHSSFTITLDDDTVLNRQGVGVLVANFSKLQFDLPVASENLPRDGLLDVVILGTNNAVELIPGLISTILDKEHDAKNRMGLEFYKAKKVEVVADPALPVQYDGEPVEGTSPYVARILPGAARYVVCQECYDQYA